MVTLPSRRLSMAASRTVTCRPNRMGHKMAPCLTPTPCPKKTVRQRSLGIRCYAAMDHVDHPAYKPAITRKWRCLSSAVLPSYKVSWTVEKRCTDITCWTLLLPADHRSSNKPSWKMVSRRNYFQNQKQSKKRLKIVVDVIVSSVPR